MALNKLSRPKVFNVDYCGCTAAALLLNDQAIRDAIDFICQVKTKRDFVKTTVTVLKEGIKLSYAEEEQFSTIVPSTMIAGSASSKTIFGDAIGVVYISPSIRQHYPAFVHIYRCNTARVAHKLLSRLRAYLLIESHRIRIVQLEQQLLDRNLLNIDRFNAMQSHKTNSDFALSLTMNDDRHEKKPDLIKSITEELNRKINSQEPILYPPKDYDTVHVAHGDIQRAQAWKSTQPTIVGYSPIDPENNRTKQYIQTNAFSKIDQHKYNTTIGHENDQSRIPTHRADTIVDPVETVNMAFDFLKDETSSIFTETDGNIERIEMQQHTKPAVYRFRPPQITAVTKKLFNRSNNYELTNGISQSNSNSRNDLDAYNTNTNTATTTTNNNNNTSNNNYYHNQRGLIQNNRQCNRSDMRLDYDLPSNTHQSPFYESRLVKSSGVAITKNPIWTDTPPSMAGSQPNLLSTQNPLDSIGLNYEYIPQMNTRLSSIPAQHSVYASYPDNKPNISKKYQENNQRRSAISQQQPSRRQATQSQYLDTNEFILRSSDNQPFRNSQHPNRQISRDSRPHSMINNPTTGPMFDVYY